MATRPCLLTRPRRSRVLFCVIAVVATTLLSNGFAFHGTVCTTSPSPPVSCDEGRGAFPPASGRAEVEKTRKLQERGWVGGAMIVAIGIAGLGNAVSKRDRSAVSAVPERKEARSWVQESIPVLLIMILVAQKCSADALTWYTRAKQHVPYSGSNVALLSEVFKFPVLMLAVSIFNSPKQVLPTIRAAFTESPFTMWWLGLLYAVQNLLYFVCLQYTSAAAYQVLSQTKMIFTAAFMGQMLGKKFSQTQILALIMLVIGTSFTQLAEIQGPMVAGSRPWLGAGLAVLSALLSALPNVFLRTSTQGAEESMGLELANHHLDCHMGLDHQRVWDVLRWHSRIRGFWHAKWLQHHGLGDSDAQNSELHHHPSLPQVCRQHPLWICQAHLYRLDGHRDQLLKLHIASTHDAHRYLTGADLHCDLWSWLSWLRSDRCAEQGVERVETVEMDLHQMREEDRVT
ncbi:unnamed protein product [Durusdinium trenchii]|uniref:Uncharacterized protein n=1 Tax=Durusdinium trenchii TaxID=1381693 RepID=A0ABP0I2S1_9DINO